MNDLEKQSFYSFLALYIISSTMFIVLGAYFYLNSQTQGLKRNEFLNIEYISNSVSQDIIAAHMRGKEYILKDFEGAKVALFDMNMHMVQGELDESFIPKNPGTFEVAAHKFLVSDASQEHLNIKFVVVQTPLLLKGVSELKHNVLMLMLFSIIVMIVLAWVLSKLFMRPLHQKIKQIEDFVHDTAHELNTPITALSMSVSRALKKQSYDEKILKNISISTKQLFDIYSALSYLSFESKQGKESALDIAQVLQKSVSYHQELAQSKKIQIELESTPYSFEIDGVKLTMLFGNLINNAIKYSHPNSKIQIECNEGRFKIKDYGIGIEKEKLSKIYERFNRETEYAGGFGIGLSIVKKIVQEYGLELEVVSKPSEGSTFSIDFTR